MSVSQIHYLSCLDQNCEKFPCVARRDYENQIQFQRGLLRRAQTALKSSARLIIRINPLTAEWRHMRTKGRTVGDDHMNRICDSQIEAEDLTDDSLMELHAHLSEDPA